MEALTRVLQPMEKDDRRPMVKRVKEFFGNSVSRETSRTDVKRFIDKGSCVFKTKKVAPNKVSTPEMIRRVQNAMNNHPNLSTRRMAQRVGVSKSSVHNMLKKGPTPVKAYKKRTIPKMPTDEKAQRMAAGKLYQRLLNPSEPHILIIDVTKEQNSTNVLQARPIEVAWTLLKHEVFSTCSVFISEEQLKRRIMYCRRNIDLTPVARMVLDIKRKLRIIHRKGVAALN